MMIILLNLIYLALFFDYGLGLLPTDLLKDYDKRLSPYYFTHKATLVSVAVPTFNLKEVFGADTMASFLYVINMEWQDSRLAFDPKDFNNDTYIYLPISEIWRPIVKNANAVESKKVNERNEEDRSEAQIMSDGRVQTSDVYYSKILCSGRMDRFPFDIQFCDVSLMNFSVNQTVMRLQAVRTESHFFMGNAEFHATNYIAASIKPQLIGFYNKLEFVISLERKTFYFIFVIVLPAALITTLTITGVMLPSSAEEPGDPVNIGLTSLLALSITFTVVADNFPRSAKVPLLGWFVLICLLLCVISVFLGIFLMKLRRSKLGGRSYAIFEWISKWRQGKVTKKESLGTIAQKQIIKGVSYSLFLLLHLFLGINLLVFFSFAWNKDKYEMVQSLEENYDVV